MQATLPVNAFLEFFCGVGGDIRHFVFEYCFLDVLASFGQTSWLCCEAVQEYQMFEFFFDTICSLWSVINTVILENLVHM